MLLYITICAPVTPACISTHMHILLSHVPELRTLSFTVPIELNQTCFDSSIAIRQGGTHQGCLTSQRRGKEGVGQRIDNRCGQRSIKVSFKPPSRSCNGIEFQQVVGNASMLALGRLVHISPASMQLPDRTGFAHPRMLHRASSCELGPHATLTLMTCRQRMFKGRPWFEAIGCIAVVWAEAESSQGWPQAGCSEWHAKSQ